jgi:hypothetical protein
MLFVRKWWRWLLLLDKGREHPRGGKQLVVHVRRGLIWVRVRAETESARRQPDSCDRTEPRHALSHGRITGSSAWIKREASADHRAGERVVAACTSTRVQRVGQSSAELVRAALLENPPPHIIALLIFRYDGSRKRLLSGAWFPAGKWTVLREEESEERFAAVSDRYRRTIM